MLIQGSACIYSKKVLHERGEEEEEEREEREERVCMWVCRYGY